ncbi:MAG: hypothetical protein IT381_21130 [Deltaproteobacteria bacterium]|nr:hypothetical protein [Deltaproteobacteria bacterium]
MTRPIALLVLSFCSCAEIAASEPPAVAEPPAQAEPRTSAASDPSEDGFLDALNGVPRGVRIDARIDGNLGDLGPLLGQANLGVCALDRVVLATYGELTLANVRFGSRSALDECIEQVLVGRAQSEKPLMQAVLMILQAAVFPWFTKGDLGIGLVDRRLLVVYRKGGLVLANAEVIDAWHGALALREKRRDIDLNALLPATAEPAPPAPPIAGHEIVAGRWQAAGKAYRFHREGTFAAEAPLSYEGRWRTLEKSDTAALVELEFVVDDKPLRTARASITKTKSGWQLQLEGATFQRAE